MALMFGLVAWQWRLLGGRSFFTVTGKGYTPRVTRLGRWRWVTFGVCVLFFVVTVVLPVSQLVLGSFFKFFGFYRMSMLTADHYAAVWQNRLVWRSATRCCSGCSAPRRPCCSARSWPKIGRASC